jgi:hypothetical protein
LEFFDWKKKKKVVREQLLNSPTRVLNFYFSVIFTVLLDAAYALSPANLTVAE